MSATTSVRPIETPRVRIDLYEKSPGLLLNEREVASALGVAVKTVQRWRQLGRGPKVVRFEGHVRYIVRDVVEYVERDRG